MLVKRFCAILLAVSLLLSCVALTWASSDAQGTKDHPLFNRMPGYSIKSYKEVEFDSQKFKLDKGVETVEGHKYVISYSFDKSGEKPSNVQIIRNYTNAIKKIGGKVLYEDSDEATIKVSKGGTETWAKLSIGGGASTYALQIIEKQAMRQDIVADAEALLGGLGESGHVAVHGIYFDTDRSEIKPESDSAIAEVAKLLKLQPGLRLYVVGHTDNVGDFDHNMKLSHARAEAVVRALVGKHGVDSKRLKSAGAGPTAPVASNRTDDGRSKNRRVELVEQ